MLYKKDNTHVSMLNISMLSLYPLVHITTNPTPLSITSIAVCTHHYHYLLIVEAM